MRSWQRSTILTASSLGGGLFLTFLSGLYIVKPFVLDAEIIYFGFPLPWLEAARSTWVPQMPWRYLFLWDGFIADFIMYGLLVATAVGIYFMSLLKRKKPSI